MSSCQLNATSWLLACGFVESVNSSGERNVHVRCLPHHTGEAAFQMKSTVCGFLEPVNSSGGGGRRKGGRGGCLPFAFLSPSTPGLQSVSPLMGVGSSSVLARAHASLRSLCVAPNRCLAAVAAALIMYEARRCREQRLG